MSPTTLPPEILALAETLNFCIPLAPDKEKIVEPGWAAFIGVKPDPHRDVVERIRLAPGDVEATVTEVRALYRARGRTEITWEIGPSSTPPDLFERLTALGMVPDREPEVAGMVLLRPPACTTADVTVRLVDGLADFRAHTLIYARTFGREKPLPSDAEIAAELERRRGREDHRRMYLAFDGDTPVAAAEALLVEAGVVLAGGATLPEARGKGAYRALIAARWEAAVARGTPVLVVQAGKMSTPILTRLGFERVATVRVLLDRFA